MFYNRKLCSYIVVVVCKIQIDINYWYGDKSNNNNYTKMYKYYHIRNKIEIVTSFSAHHYFETMFYL